MSVESERRDSGRGGNVEDAEGDEDPAALAALFLRHELVGLLGLRASRVSPSYHNKAGAVGNASGAR